MTGQEALETAEYTTGTGTSHGTENMAQRKADHPNGKESGVKVGCVERKIRTGGLRIDGKILASCCGFSLMVWTLHFLEDDELQDSEGPDNHTDIVFDRFSFDWWVYKVKMNRDIY